MGTGYTRNDTANNIADGNVINAADFDGEYDAIEAAFNSSTGHTHDGTAAEGGPITVLGPSQEFVASASAVAPSTNAGLDLGTTSLKFNDLYIDGTAYIDGLGGNLLVDTSNALQFRDAQLSISSSADGQLDIAADTTAKITSPEVIVTDDFRLQSDASILTFGADDDVTVTHVADIGLDAQAASGFTLRLQTGDTTVESGNTIGKISFNAPDEASGTDAILVGAEIEAAAEATFSSTVNSTALVFKTNDSAAATERMRIKSDGDIVLKGASYDFVFDASAHALTTSASNGDLNITPHGTGTVVITGDLDVDNINIDGNTISSTDTNGDINLTPNGTGKVNISGGFVPSEVSLTSDDAGATKGPQFDVFRNSASPADGDAIGYIDFSANDSDSNKTVYASILATAEDVTDSTEDGTLKLNTMVAGTDTTIMTLKEANVGIGTSSPTTSYGRVLQIHDTGTSGASLRITDSNSGAGTGNGGELLQLNTAMYLINRENGILVLSTNDTERVRIDGSGQVGIGATPETWSLGKALHIGVPENALWGEGDYAFHMAQNGYYNSGWKYTHTDQATLYSQEDGNHVWKYAASGTADAALTWSEAMRTDNSGTLLIGRTTTPSAAGAKIAAGSTGDTALELTKDGVASVRVMAVSSGLALGADGSDGATERMRIDASTGKVGIATDSPDDTLTVGGETLAYGNALGGRTLGVRGGVLGGVGGDSVNLAYFGFESTNNNTAGLNLKAYRTSTGNDWTTTGLKFTFNVDNTDPVYNNMLCFQGGKIGIGDDSPGQQLSVDGNMILGNSSSTGKIFYLASASGYSPRLQESSNNLLIATNNTERLRVRNDGIVSINDTTDPTSGGFDPLLHMKQSTDSIFGALTIENNDTDAVGGMGWGSDEFGIGASFRATAGYNNIGFYAGGGRHMLLKTDRDIVLRNGVVATTNHSNGSITFADITGASNSFQDGPGIEGSASDGNGRRDAGCRIIRTPGTGGGTTSGVGVGLYVSSNTYAGYTQAFNNTLAFVARAYSFMPYQDNTSNLGDGSYRWDNIYATNATIQTSDQREKQQIATLTDAEMTAAKAISGLFKTYKWNSAVAEKGDNARIHAGVIAQDVVSVMEANGLDASRYAFFTSNTWWEETVDVPAKEEVLDEDGLVRQVAQPATTEIVKHNFEEDAPEGAVEVQRFGIRYPELLAFIGAATEQRLASIEARLDVLEG